MLLGLLVTALLFAASAFAKNDSKKCARELQDLIHAPQILKHAYLRRAAAAFPGNSPTFWTSNISIVGGDSSDPSFNSLLLAFENAWGVTVLLTLSGGEQYYYTPNSLTVIAPFGNDLNFVPTIFSHDLDQSNLKLGSFTSNLDVSSFTTIGVDIQYSYTFITANRDGVVRYVSLWLSTGNAHYG
jgi:hypothetical protein